MWSTFPSRRSESTFGLPIDEKFVGSFTKPLCGVSQLSIIFTLKGIYTISEEGVSWARFGVVEKAPFANPNKCGNVRNTDRIHPFSGGKCGN